MRCPPRHHRHPHAARRGLSSAAPASGQWGRTWSSDRGTPQMPVQGAVRRWPAAITDDSTHERAVGSDLVFGSRNAPHACSECRRTVACHHKRDATVAHACGDRAHFDPLPCGLFAPTAARSLSPSALPVGPRRREDCSVARAPIGGAPAARKTSQHERTLAADAPPCNFPRPGTPRRTAPFGDGLAQPARRSPRTRCVWPTRCLCLPLSPSRHGDCPSLRLVLKPSRAPSTGHQTLARVRLHG